MADAHAQWEALSAKDKAAQMAIVNEVLDEVIAEEKAAEQLVAAVKKRGGQPRDARDAAHEACHALDAGLEDKWTRDNVHEAITEFCTDRVFDRGKFLYYEIRARAVEMTVCKRLGIEYDLEEWANTCYLESVTVSHITPPSYEWLRDRIKAAAGMKTTAAQVERILELR